MCRVSRCSPLPLGHLRKAVYVNGVEAIASARHLHGEHLVTSSAGFHGEGDDFLRYATAEGRSVRL